MFYGFNAINSIYKTIINTIKNSIIRKQIYKIYDNNTIHNEKKR